VTAVRIEAIAMVVRVDNGMVYLHGSMYGDEQYREIYRGQQHSFEPKVQLPVTSFPTETKKPVA